MVQIQLQTSISSKHGCKKEASEINQSIRDKFFATYQPQDFNLPDFVMFYLAKNPTSPELYQKMVKTCKDFFVKNPILLVTEFSYSGGNKWQLSPNRCPRDLSKILSKLWITGRLNVKNENFINPYLLSSVMPKLYQCVAKIVSIYNQILFFHDLSLLISSAERIFLENFTVKDKNGKNVGIEKIVEIAVNAKNITFQSVTNLLNITPNTMKELLKIPHFSKLCVLIMTGIPDTFDLDTFSSYMKKNKTTTLWLRFDDSISETYQNRLVEMIDEIRAAGTFDYKPPIIRFGPF